MASDQRSSPFQRWRTLATEHKLAGIAIAVSVVLGAPALYLAYQANSISREALATSQGVRKINLKLSASVRPVDLAPLQNRKDDGYIIHAIDVTVDNQSDVDAVVQTAWAKHNDPSDGGLVRPFTHGPFKPIADAMPPAVTDWMSAEFPFILPAHRSCTITFLPFKDSWRRDKDGNGLVAQIPVDRIVVRANDQEFALEATARDLILFYSLVPKNKRTMTMPPPGVNFRFEGE